jgi:hypothetical protein
VILQDRLHHLQSLVDLTGLGGGVDLIDRGIGGHGGRAQHQGQRQGGCQSQLADRKRHHTSPHTHHCHIEEMPETKAQRARSGKAYRNFKMNAR